MDNGETILDRVRSERGYTLSYHEVFARTEPPFLKAYANLYRACTLDERFLTPRRRELVWVCLLTAIREDVGSIHVDRARAAGVSDAEVQAAIRLAGLVEAWDAFAFAYGRWSDSLAGDGPTEYDRLVESASAPLDRAVIDLMLVVAHGARRCKEALVFHLKGLSDAGTPDEEVAEALSYLLQPVGANTLLWATDAWLDALHSGVLPPSELLGDGSFETRRR